MITIEMRKQKLEYNKRGDFIIIIMFLKRKMFNTQVLKLIQNKQREKNNYNYFLLLKENEKLVFYLFVLVSQSVNHSIFDFISQMNSIYIEREKDKFKDKDCRHFK